MSQVFRSGTNRNSTTPSFRREFRRAFQPGFARVRTGPPLCFALRNIFKACFTAIKKARRREVVANLNAYARKYDLSRKTPVPAQTPKYALFLKKERYLCKLSVLRRQAKACACRRLDKWIPTFGRTVLVHLAAAAAFFSA